MRVCEAKDFLVQQTAEQAVLENVPLSGLEKRMMYFTETGECPEGPIALNGAFEAEYDTTTYEKKISRLMAGPIAELSGRTLKSYAYGTKHSVFSVRAELYLGL
jgi:hypothetical protein